MNNNYLGLIGYFLVIINIILTININHKKSLPHNIIHIIGYSIIFLTIYEGINKHGKNEDEEEYNNNFEYGHIILFMSYFFDSFISKIPFNVIYLIGLYAHFLLIKENKIIVFGYILSFIYYTMEIFFDLDDINLLFFFKIIPFILLSIFYFNNIINEFKKRYNKKKIDF